MLARLAIALICRLSGAAGRRPKACCADDFEGPEPSLREAGGDAATRSTCTAASHEAPALGQLVRATAHHGQ